MPVDESGLHSADNKLIIQELEDIEDKLSDFDETFPLVAADATSDGNQYSKTITAPAGGSSSSFVTLYEADDISPKVLRDIVWIYFLIVVNLKESGVNGDIYWKPQAKNHDGETWGDLADWQKITHDASSAADYRLEDELSWVGKSDYDNLTDTNLRTRLTKVPMDFRVIFYTDHATETAEGKLKNASRIRVICKAT